jgi:hypothetical protein
VIRSLGPHPRPELGTPRTTALLEPINIVVEDVAIDVEGGRVEVERVH